MARKQVSFEESDKLNFTDFIPECLEEGGFIRKPVYENFQTLLYKANRWLKAQYDVIVISCEVLEVPCKPNIQGYPAKPVDPENPYFELIVMSDTGLVINPYIHMLRLWYGRNGTKDKQPQVIAYMNFVPNCVEAGGMFKSPKFESMLELKERLKEQLKKSPVGGIISNVQTYTIRFQNWRDVHPDLAFYSGCDSVYSVEALRVFYVKSSCSTSDLDFIDICPTMLERAPQEGKKDKNLTWESFRSLYSRVVQWFNDQNGIDIINIQTLCQFSHNLSKDGKIDTTKLFSKLNAPMHIIYFIRVYYNRRPIKSQSEGILLPTLSKTVIPSAVSKASTFKSSKFESMSAVAGRLGRWYDIKRGIIKVLGVETINLPLRPKEDPVCDISTTYHFCKVGICPIQWVFSVRAYVRHDGGRNMDQELAEDNSLVSFSD